MNNFEKFYAAHKQEVLNMRETLAEELSDEPETLMSQARKVEALYGRSLFLLSKANGLLDLAEWERLPRPSKLMTVLDRQSSIKSSCAPEKEFRDIIEGIVNAIKQRVMLSQSLLNFHRDLYLSQPHLKEERRQNEK